MNKITFQVHLKTTFKRKLIYLQNQKMLRCKVSCNLKLHIVSVAQEDHMQHSPSSLRCLYSLSPPHNTHEEVLAGCRKVAVALAGRMRVAGVQCYFSSSLYSSR